MAPIRYSLHYEDYSEHLMSRFGKLLQTQSLVDMTLMCSSHTLRVHKAVLAASSAYFQEVLQKQAGEPLIILKMRFNVLKCLVEFMYCGKTHCLEENLDELVSAAQFLKIKGLSKVTKQGLGIANNSELPIFTPPVVINRPPQSLIDLHTQESDPKPAPSQLVPATSTSLADNLGRTNKDMVVRIPFDIENGGGASSIDYSDPSRTMKSRRGKPIIRRPGGSWTENSSPLGRAAERALLRREQDSRKAIHHLKHLQTRHMQDYMDRVTISQAVNSICGSEASSNYMNIDNDLNIYMDQQVTSNNLDSTLPYSKATTAIEAINSDFSTGNTSSIETGQSEISSAMSQYVNALKSAGLPTDLPILFESGDGSYINVNEQVLLDMVQSSEIQYEVIEQPNIIEKVADPSEIKSIDDLSKSIERGEMLLGNKSYQTHEYNKDSTRYNNQDDALSSLNTILPDTLESYNDQPGFVVMDPRLQENNSLDPVNPSDFSCIDGDFFTKSMNEDVKKFYENQHLNDTRVIDQLCPTSTLETNLSMSLLDSKISNLNENLNQPYNPLNIDDIRRNEDDCYDFGLQLPQSNVFKEDSLDCLMSTPKRNEGSSYEDSNQLDDRGNKEREEIINDLMNIEHKMLAQNTKSIDCDDSNTNLNIQTLDDSNANFNDDKKADNSPRINDVCDSYNPKDEDNHEPIATEKQDMDCVIDLTEPVKSNEYDCIKDDDKENNESENNSEKRLEDDVPYAVGLLPLKQAQTKEASSRSDKRKRSKDVDDLDYDDAKCLKRNVR